MKKLNVWILAGIFLALILIGILFITYNANVIYNTNPNVPMKIKIATFNVQSGVGTTSGYLDYILTAWKYVLPHSLEPFAKVAAFVKSENLDIVSFEEIENSSFRSSGTNETKTISELSGLENWIFFPTYKTRIINQGNGVVSRYKIEKTESYRLPGNAEPRYLGVSLVDVNGRKINILTTHLGLNKDERKSQLEMIAEKVNEINGSIVLMGDFNVADAGELSPLNKTDLVSIDNAFTFPSWGASRKFDYIFISPDIKLIRSYVSDVKASDHLPLVAEIEIK